MHIKYISLLLPTLLTGCANLSARHNETNTPALVFVDGQISESTDIIAQTQRRLSPPPVRTPPSISTQPRTMTTPAPTPTIATAAPAKGLTSVSQPLPSPPLLTTPLAATAPAIASGLANLTLSGTTPSVPVVHRPLTRNQTVGQLVKQLLPSDWQLRQDNAATAALNTRLVTWSANDQWHRALNQLLQEQHLYGHLDWNQKVLTITTSASAPATPTAVATQSAKIAKPVTTQFNQPVVTRPSSGVVPPTNPFRNSAPNNVPATPEKSSTNRLVMSGSEQTAPVLFLSASDNLTLEQWVRRILPDGWSLEWSGITQQSRNAKPGHVEVNDQWHRALNQLLARQNLWGHLNWNAHSLIITASATAPITASAPTAKPTNLTGPVAPVNKTGEASPVPLPQPRTVMPSWVAEKGSTLRQTLNKWAEKAACEVPGQHWTVMWSSAVDYPIDARFAWTGTWQEALSQTFELYRSARTPLFATVYQKQCIVNVTDRTP